jgi:hypothetical protein
MIKIRQSIEARVKRFDEAIRSARSEKVALQLLRDKKRWLCRNDLFYLCALTGNHKISTLPSVFVPFCDEVSLMNWKIIQLGMFNPSDGMLRIDEVADIEDLFEQRLYLCYRAFFKSTILTKVHSLQLLLNFPNIRICLLHNKQDNSSDNLITIKNFFRSTEVGVLFPECIPDGKEWGNLSGFSLANKTDISRSEESIEAIGVGTEITGRHWDVAKKDDMVTEDSINTEEQIKKTEDYDDRFNAGHFSDPRFNLQDYSGTRYHFADLYSKKLSVPGMKVICIPFEDGNGNSTHPERFSNEDVAKKKGNMNPWVYNCQLQLKPEDPARMQFNRGMIQYWDKLPSELNYYLETDPASAKKKKSDYTVMLVIGVGKDRQGRRLKFIADGIRDKLNPKQRVDAAIELAKKWKIKGCAWEAIGFQETDCVYLEEKRRVEKLFFDITEIKSHQSAKEDRIRSLVPQYSNHEWFWPAKGKIVKHSVFDGKNYDLTEKMEYELEKFPLGEHDDLMDAQTFIDRISTIENFLKSIDTSPVEPPKGLTFGDITGDMEQRKNMQRRSPWERLSVPSVV